MVRVVGEGDIETSSAPVEAKLKLRLSLAAVGKPICFAQVGLRLTVFYMAMDHQYFTLSLGRPVVYNFENFQTL